MSLSIVTNARGTFFQLGEQILLRGYGGLKSEVSSFKSAIDAGIRFFDGAYAYKDGPKLKEALEGREISHFTLSSKIPGFKLDIKDLKGSTRSCFNEILKGLNTEKIDILYLHGPDCILEDVMEALLELQKEEKFTYLGLCNVNKETVEALVNAGYPISAIQNEINPYFWDEDVLKYCRDRKIAVIGYRPFGDKQCSEMFQNTTLATIAHRVNSSVSAVILQWMNQSGVTPIPHSNTTERIKANAEIPQWSLSQEEMEQINAIKQGSASTCGWEKFLNKDLFAKSKDWIEELKIPLLTF